jgi:hypothetical protein
LGVTVAAGEPSSDCAPGFEVDWKAYMSGMALRDVITPRSYVVGVCGIDTLQDAVVRQLTGVKVQLTCFGCVARVLSCAVLCVVEERVALRVKWNLAESGQSLHF